MAEVLLNDALAGQVRALSAGTEPQPRVADGAIAALALWGTGGQDIPFSAAMKLMKWYPLLTLPMFIYMGYMLSESKIADDLSSARLVLPWLLGSLGEPAAFTGFLVPLREALASVFFVSIGMLLDLPAIAADAAMVALLLVSIIAGKFLLVFLTAALLRLPLRVCVLTGAALAQVGEFSFVLLKGGRDACLFSGPFLETLLVAVILSAQATDISVNKATSKLYPVANTPAAILELGVDGLKPYIQTIGLFNSKAKNIIQTCRILMDEHDSQVPDDQKKLEALPGVGRKTANVVRNTAFGHPTMAVDTHIFRVSNRTRIAPGKTVLEVEKKLLRHIPQEFLQDAHHWLILHGRYVCKARKPLCGECAIEPWCEYRKKELP